MEATIVYWGFIGIMEKKMEATIVSIGEILDLTTNLWYLIGPKVRLVSEGCIQAWKVPDTNGKLLAGS